MPKTKPFDENTVEYDEWFTKNQSAYESELQAVRGMLPDGGRAGPAAAQRIADG